MAAYEMSFKLRHISTATKRQGRATDSVAGATAKAKSRIAYIARRDGAKDDDHLIFGHGGQVQAGVPRDEALALMRAATDARAKKHRPGGVGVRLMDTLMVSLPRDATFAEQQEMAQRMVARLVGRSEAHALAAIHSDKKGNPHLHIAFLDGLETAEQARLRNPDAKRVRRMEYGKLNEGGKPKQLRAEFAAIINAVGRPEGRRKAEHRSFKERGLEGRAQIHEGVSVQDKTQKGKDPHEAAARRVAENLEIIRARAGKDISKVPDRWKRTRALLDFWIRRLGLAPPPAEKQATTSVQPVAKAPVNMGVVSQKPTFRRPQKAPDDQVIRSMPQGVFEEDSRAEDFLKAVETARRRPSARTAYQAAQEPPKRPKRRTGRDDESR